jgi:transposase
MDRRLLECTLEVAAAIGAFGVQQLRAALDRRPWWGAGRAEDPDNLLGHALRKSVGVLARQQGWELPEGACEAGASLGRGSRLIAALDLDGDAPRARQQALSMILDALYAVDHWLATYPEPLEADRRVPASLAVAPQVLKQDITTTPADTPPLRPGVAEDLRLMDGDKRHVRRNRDSQRIVAVGSTPATAPEASVTEAIEAELAGQQATLHEWPIERAYLASSLVQQRADGVAMFCKAWPVRQGPSCPKTAFKRDWERQELRCPGGVTMSFAPGGVVKLPGATCARCALRERCTTSVSGRSVSIHPDEALLQEWRARQQTPHGRAKLREQVAMERALAHMGRWQGRRARYRGVRKHVFELRRCAVVHNLHVLVHLTETEQQAA